MNKAMSEQEKTMTMRTVIDLYQGLTERGIKIWLDGGWGVDALLRQQTRQHGDVDMIVQKKDVFKLNTFFKYL